jgi:Uma2 family endonuclease
VAQEPACHSSDGRRDELARQNEPMSPLANTPALVSVDEYLHRTDNCEYIEGVLQAKAMPTKLHSLLQYALVGLLRSLGLEALQKVTVRISATKYLVPDVIAAPRIQNPYPTEPVLLCIEI